jgi:hypothetical protein
MTVVFSKLLDLDDEFREFKNGQKCWFNVSPMEVGRGFYLCTLHVHQDGQGQLLKSRRMHVQRSWGREEVFRQERLDICKRCQVKIIGERT